MVTFTDYLNESKQRQERLDRLNGNKRECNLNFNFLCELYGSICSCIRSCGEGRPRW